MTLDVVCLPIISVLLLRSNLLFVGRPFWIEMDITEILIMRVQLIGIIETLPKIILGCLLINLLLHLMLG